MKNNPTFMRILILEDEILIARAIEQLLYRHFDCDTRLAISVEEAEEEIENFTPHLILCDINLNGMMEGIDFIKEAQEKLHFETIFVTANATKNIIEKAVLSTHANFIVKPFDETQLVATVQLAQSRLKTMPHAGTFKINMKDILSKTECKILYLISDNKMTSEIADTLFISPNTVKNHRHNISRKLKLSTDNNALVKWAIENRQLLGMR
jgi:DNA-binding NarL/FixJ family response regulator